MSSWGIGSGEGIYRVVYRTLFRFEWYKDIKAIDPCTAYHYWREKYNSKSNMVRVYKLKNSNL